MNWRRVWWVVPVMIVLVGYWFLPISGRVMIISGAGDQGVWPRFDFEGQPLQRGASLLVRVTDVKPWPFVHLVSSGAAPVPVGQAVEVGPSRRGPGTWTWTWRLTVPEGDGYTLVFYHDCHTGCRERGRARLGVPELPPSAATATSLPTKLGLVMPNPGRDWHGRAGWAVEVTYALRPEASYWGVDDLASRVALHRAKGLRVLVRVEYEQQQSLPPTDDYMALAEYLAYFRRLARDDRLRGVYGYIVGSDYNAADASALSPNRATTPAWYARLFNGYGEAPLHTDNVLQVIRAENASVRVIVGPLRPWAPDSLPAHELARASSSDWPDVPWLAYMDALVRFLDAGARAKAEVGVPLAAPDGFDVQAPGRPDAPEMSAALRADEPEVSLEREAWDGAQAGFRIYEDWMAIINAYPATRGVPLYIVSTNTYDRETGIPPAQNYPKGWLTTALRVTDAEPQVHAMVWFLDDFPHGDEWNWFSLTEQPGRLVDAAEEFDALLRLP